MHVLTGGFRHVCVHVDRSSAHFAAWHSPKREPEKFGQHFKLDDCRVWMRCVKVGVRVCVYVCFCVRVRAR